jgi:hypothetical protein
MNTIQFEYEARSCPAQSKLGLNQSILALSVHHSHHHGHPAR